jgi:SDR family mycofactocin-dependent oxidoreductase
MSSPTVGVDPPIEVSSIAPRVARSSLPPVDGKGDEDVGRFSSKVVFITGGARGQGRSHAITLAQEGADIVLFDVPDAAESVLYPLATADDLKQTQAMVAALGHRCLAIEGDVRSYPSLEAAAQRTVDEFGQVDVLLANAGVASFNEVARMPPAQWHETIDINLHGVFHAIHAVLPHMLSRNYGRIVATASTMGRMGAAGGAAYAASKWAIIGLVKSVALETAKSGITVNAVAPTAVNTHLIMNDPLWQRFRPDLENPTWEDVEAGFAALIPQGVPYIEAIDVSRAIASLASDDARHVTGSVLDVSGGKAGHWTA